jgi:N-acetylmuramoyl-L-alanine amidase
VIRSPLAHDFMLSPNVGTRREGAQVDILLLHYTGMVSAAAARDWLCHPASKVSCHYLVDEDGLITQMVDEDLRGWHAGFSSWKGRDDINSASIGIEIQNPGHMLGYRAFPAAQMASVIALCRDILKRHAIPPSQVLAHSDVAPLRKIDPGEKFDWQLMRAQGLGHWVAPAPITESEMLKTGDKGDAVRELQEALARYGYGLACDGHFGRETKAAVQAFQRHFRPARVDGCADHSTTETLRALLAAL